MGNDVPFEPYTNGIVSFDTISDASRGAIRPAWELLHSHYVQIKGLDAPWTTAYLNKSLEYFGGFEGGAGSWGEGSGHYDGLGWGSLLHHLDESDVRELKSSALPSVTSSKSHSQVAQNTQVPTSLAHLDAVSKPITQTRASPTTTASHLPAETNVSKFPVTQPIMTKKPHRKAHKVKTGCRPPA